MKEQRHHAVFDGEEMIACRCGVAVTGDEGYADHLATVFHHVGFTQVPGLYYANPISETCWVFLEYDNYPEAEEHCEEL